MKYLATLAFCATVLIGNVVKAQQISLSGQLGYAGPQGDAFKDEATGERLSSFGLGLDFDALYNFEDVHENLFAGITYNTNILFGQQSDGGFDVGIYGLNLYGVKGLYRFLDRGFSPYGALSLGLSHFATPELTSGTEVVVEGENAFSFGIRPEVGLDINGFLISAAYFVPMNYDVSSGFGAFSGSAGALQISLGYRVTFDSPF